MSLKACERTPKWVVELAGRVQKMMGCEDWEIDIHTLPIIDNDESLNGQCHPRPFYLRATVKLLERHMEKETWDSRDTVIHEMLHPVFEPLMRCATRLCDMHPPRMALELRDFSVAELERSITLLSRALQAHLYPPEEP